MSDFELNKAQWYKVEDAEPDAWRNDKLASEDYGIWYKVKFFGDAERYGWMTKTPPEAGSKYWGWLEKSSTGKSVKFKWDKKNTPILNGESSGESKVGGWHESPEKQASINRAVALNNAVLYSQGNECTPTDVLDYADRFLGWLSDSSTEVEDN